MMNEEEKKDILQEEIELIAELEDEALDTVSGGRLSRDPRITRTIYRCNKCNKIYRTAEMDMPCPYCGADQDQQKKLR